ncbi:prolactin-like protein L [Rattus norvegicus]|uniref:Prolactin-5A1 n=2 Tax=Rattus norvegicus TaxID=10116 RepID=PR5A1_RAT|nr:prolactin-5A1 precursor [Rattus norvegicus]Q9JII4.1 RecName: Full=Prolactin-5A1; AltName: Full=Placental prolactin-like protein L; Short=PLP-L; Short=PRL-like protein L; Flags: Precursor [Rattus norvegicus]AAF89996.1 prolactin-like protein L [Rattus norvegicus]EDL98396.1 prolactin-like protein L [Rattus norvegicus]CDW51441.1 TPA: growth hormone d1 [Rattus norvegicus]
MQIQPHPSGALLLLLLSNLLMWENVASVPRCIMENGGCQKVLNYLFNMTSTISESFNTLSSETLNDFYTEFDPHQTFQNRPAMTCHTSSRSIPNNKRKAERMEPAALLNVIIRMLASWKNLLYHVENNMANLDGTPYAIISKVKLIDRQIKKLTKNLQDIKTILSQVHPELKEKENYPVWSGEPYVQKSKRRTQLFGLHSLFFCLYSDAEKVSDYVNILRNKIVPNE